MINITFDDHELISAMIAVTDALDRAAERVMKKNVPHYALEHHNRLKTIHEKLSKAYTETDI
jgi:hypothetical protein